MLKVESPSLNYKNILIKCVEGIKDKELQKNVYMNISNFVSRSENYAQLAQDKKLFQIEGTLKDDFNHKDMMFLYGKLRDSPHARTYYDYILGTSIACPYCGVQLSASLDHYLPKKHYPMYSIDPINLVPCCSDCNSKKSEHKQLKGSETFHPYFDTFSNEKFVFAQVTIKEENVAFNYYIDKPSDLSDEDFSKIQNHFELLRLGDFYSILASGEIHSQIFGLKELHKEGGGVAVAKSLNDIYRSNLNTGVNNWKTALYEGLMHDTWFCDEGIHRFQYISKTRDEALTDEEDIKIPNFE